MDVAAALDPPLPSPQSHRTTYICFENDRFLYSSCVFAFLKDLNVIMSNEVEKKITKQNNFYKATLQGVPWEQGVGMD